MIESITGFRNGDGYGDGYGNGYGSGSGYGYGSGNGKYPEVYLDSVYFQIVFFASVEGIFEADYDDILLLMNDG